MTTPPTWPAGPWPRPHELADWLAKATRAEVVQFCARAIENSEAALACLVANHEEAIGRMQAERDREAEDARMRTRWR